MNGTNINFTRPPEIRRFFGIQYFGILSQCDGTAREEIERERQIVEEASFISLQFCFELCID